MQLKPRQTGFTLVEVLITIFVVAIGLLGAAALQVAAKKAAFEAVQRGQASVIAQDLLERMRANSTALDTYVSTGALVDSAHIPAAQACDTTACTSIQQAAHDLNQFWLGLAGASETTAASVSGGLTGVGGLRDPTGCVFYRRTSSASTTSIKNSCRTEVVITWRGLTPQAPSGEACGATGLSTEDLRYRRRLVLVGNISEGNPC